MLCSKYALHVPGPARVYKVFTVEAETTVLMSCPVGDVGARNPELRTLASRVRAGQTEASDSF